MQAKKAMVHKSAFPFPPIGFYNKPIIQLEVAYKIVTNDFIYKVFMTQSTSKAPGLERINFRILRIIWKSNREQLITMV